MLLIALAVLAGCGTSATITLRDNTRVVGTILGSVDQRVYVDTGRSEDAESIDRAAIRDISHPGKAAMVVGVLLMAYGAYNLAVAYPMCDEKPTSFCVGAHIPAALGLALSGYGWGVYHRSKVRARPAPDVRQALRLQIHLLPSVAMGRPVPGLGLAARF